jgi:hypothetical protein
MSSFFANTAQKCRVVQQVPSQNGEAVQQPAQQQCPNPAGSGWRRRGAVQAWFLERELKIA